MVIPITHNQISIRLHKCIEVGRLYSTLQIYDILSKTMFVKNGPYPRH